MILLSDDLSHPASSAICDPGNQVVGGGVGGQGGVMRTVGEQGGHVNWGPL
jgi:hypothetical protein